MRIPHDLLDEFPDETLFIEQLSRSNYEFRRLVARYDEANREIFQIESGATPTTDDVLEDLKRQRLKLKDDIAAALARLERRM